MHRRIVIASLLCLCSAVSAQTEAPAAGAASSASSAAGTAPATGGAPTAPPPTVAVTVQTSLGAIVLAIETGRAPLTSANFLRYVDQKRLDGSNFYRAMKVGDSGELGLVQGGVRGNPKKVLKAIAHEPTSVTGLSHVSGAISMARAAPGTATGDFFIVLGDLKSLDAHDADPAAGVDADAGYAVFGHVTEGMDVVRAILEQPVSDTAPVEAMKGQMIAKPVTITSARRSGAASAIANTPAR